MTREVNMISGLDSTTPMAGMGRTRALWRRVPFVLRWVLAVATSMVLAGTVEFAIAADRLQERLVQEALNDYQAQALGLEAVLAADLTPKERDLAVRDELGHLARSYGTLYAGLFDERGQYVAGAGETAGPQSLDPHRMRQVLSARQPSVEVEQDQSEAGSADRYEFLLPVQSPGGVLVLELDQRQSVIGKLVMDLRLLKAAGLAIAVLLAVPLSYLLGGRALHRQQRRSQRAADTDALTGVAGRRPFRPALEAALSDPNRGPVALALIDLDGFKQINDRLGHSYGDRVLVALAESFTTLRASDGAYRLGGDEFALVLPDSDDAQATAVLDRVRQQLALRAAGVTFSCGIASAQPGEVVALQELWERSDAALYQAKREGRCRTVSFTRLSTRMTVSPDKLDAVTALLAPDSQIGVAFQPIWDLRQGSVLAHEALLRLPAGTPIEGPQEAFELAHRLGVAAELDTRARDTVLATVARQQWDGLLFLNIHPDALPGLDVDALVRDVTAAGLDPADVVLEVTEQAGLDNPQPIRVLKQAHERGFRLALDDMGRSNAGLRALTHVRFDVVKVDQHVVARLATDPASAATVAAATTFVQKTGGWMIAEGIEDSGMLDAVMENSNASAEFRPVLAGQGYLLGRPAPRPIAINTRLTALDPSAGTRT